MIAVDSFYFPTSIESAKEYAAFLEESEFSGIWMADSHQLYTDVYTTLGIIADQTKSLDLFTGVTNPISRHPSVTANAVSTIDSISNKGAHLGIGAGDSGVYSIGKEPASPRELHEAVEKIQTLLAGDSVEFNGETFRLERDNGDMDVYVAAEGPVTLRMAGQVGDGIMFGGGISEEIIEGLAYENIRKGAERAGRSLDDIEMVALAPGCVAEDREAAARDLMHLLEPLAYHNFSHSVDEAPEHLHGDLQTLVENHEFREHGDEEARAVEEIPQQVQDYLGERWAIAGPPSHCRAQLRHLEEMGIDRVMILFPTGNALEYSREFNEKVLREM